MQKRRLKVAVVAASAHLEFFFGLGSHAHADDTHERRKEEIVSSFRNRVVNLTVLSRSAVSPCFCMQRCRVGPHQMQHLMSLPRSGFQYSIIFIKSSLHHHSRHRSGLSPFRGGLVGENVPEFEGLLSVGVSSS